MKPKIRTVLKRVSPLVGACLLLLLLVTDEVLASTNPDPSHLTTPDGTPSTHGDPAIWVHPTGIDDHENIGWALGNVMPGGTVLLNGSEFKLSQTVDAVHFSGAIRGLGRDVTTVHMLDNFLYSELQFERSGWKSTFAFNFTYDPYYARPYDGNADLSVSDLTIVADGDSAEIWLEHGLPSKSCAGIYVVGGNEDTPFDDPTRLNTRFERIRVAGTPNDNSDGYHPNLSNMFWPILFTRIHGGHHLWEGLSFVSTGYSLAWVCYDLTLAISDIEAIATTAFMADIWPLRLAENSSCDIVVERLKTVDAPGVELISANWLNYYPLLPHEPSSYVVEDSEISAASNTALDGFYLRDNLSGTKKSSFVVRGNTLTAGTSRSGISLQGIANSSISQNTVSGEPGSFAGIRLVDSSFNEIGANKILGSVGYPFNLSGDSVGNQMLGNNIARSEVFQLNSLYDPRCWVGDQYQGGAVFRPPSFAHEGFGEAMRFDGVATKIEVQDSPSLKFDSNRITLSAWVHPDADSSGWRTILSKMESTGSLYIVLQDDLLRVRIEGTYGDWTWAPTTIELGVWTHLAVTYDGNTLKLIKNGGEETHESTYPGGVLTLRFGTQPLYIGYNTWWPEEVFRGVLDEIHLFDRALSEAEIQQLYSGAAAIGDEVTYHSLDEATIVGACSDLLVVLDQSASLNDGIITCTTCPSVDPGLPEDQNPYRKDIGATVYLGPDAVNNSLRGNSGDSAVDEPGYNSIWWGWMPGLGYLHACDYYCSTCDPYTEHPCVGSAGSLNDDPAKPNAYQWSEEYVGGAYFDGDTWRYDPFRLPIATLDDGKQNYLTGFEPMAGAGGVGPRISNRVAPGVAGWNQAFEEFLDTDPTQEELGTWLEQNPSPVQMKQ